MSSPRGRVTVCSRSGPPYCSRSRHTCSAAGTPERQLTPTGEVDLRADATLGAKRSPWWSGDLSGRRGFAQGREDVVEQRPGGGPAVLDEPFAAQDPAEDRSR